jgi:mono/diheme cytochrome c family protein
MWLVTTWLACGEAPPPSDDGGAPTAAPAPVDPHAAHKGGSDHMAQMTAMRDTLRTELGEAYDAPVPGLDTADAAAGKALYDVHCASCHGVAGKGDGPAGAGLNPPPSDLTDAFHARFYSDAGRVRVIQKGSPGTAMVGFEAMLDSDKILQVYAYVRDFRAAAGG